MKYILFCAALVMGSMALASEGTTNKTGHEKGKSHSKMTPAQGGAPLFARLGGKTAITSVVDQFVANCGADTRINKFFQHLVADPKKMAAFKKHLVDQVCEVTGGPCKYKGRDMKTTHQGFNITETDFTALVEDLTKSLDQHKVGQKEKDELIGILATLKGEIVKPTTTTN